MLFILHVYSLSWVKCLTVLTHDPFTFVDPFDPLTHCLLCVRRDFQWETYLLSSNDPVLVFTWIAQPRYWLSVMMDACNSPCCLIQSLGQWSCTPPAMILQCPVWYVTEPASLLAVTQAYVIDSAFYDDRVEVLVSPCPSFTVSTVNRPVSTSKSDLYGSSLAAYLYQWMLRVLYYQPISVSRSHRLARYTYDTIRYDRRVFTWTQKLSVFGLI